MACVGKTKSCNTVPTNHFGPVPGVEVGRAWLYRIQVNKYQKEKNSGDEKVS